MFKRDEKVMVLRIVGDTHDSEGVFLGVFEGKYRIFVEDMVLLLEPEQITNHKEYWDKKRAEFTASGLSYCNAVVKKEWDAE